MDCHAQDGRDLKYFNYSNNSIRTRSMFHGLTAQQGDQIASYIRTLNVANPGRPWNPPYQPGPGMDSRPVSDWAAGAGIDAVLDSDQQMLNAMFPSGIQDSFFSPNGNLNVRETPIAFQLPDWNQWLPGTHPMDAFGSAFVSNGYNTIYQTIRAGLHVLDPVAYVAQKSNLDAWFAAYYGLYNQEGNPIWNNPTTGWTPATVDQMYSLPQWGMVKTWEMMNEFQLEGFPQSIFGPTAEPRAWYSKLPFFASPHMLKMPTSGVAGLRNGRQATYVYLSYIWYHLQLILNDSNGQQQDHYPIDWSYVYGFVKDMGGLSSPQAGMHTMWFIKGLQEDNPLTPDAGLEGWQPNLPYLLSLIRMEWVAEDWTGVSPATRIPVLESATRAWLSEVTRFTPQQFYKGGWASPTEVPARGAPFGDFGAQIWYTIPQLRYAGVNQTLINQLAAWAQTVWPAANWSATTTATCAPFVNDPRLMICSTEQ
jgi:hypothetical protein